MKTKVIMAQKIHNVALNLAALLLSGFLTNIKISL